MRFLSALLLVPVLLGAQPSDSNVVFGTVSGLALLMDVYKPSSSNGYGVVVVPGSGWHRTMGYDAALLKQSQELVPYFTRLTAAGYTAFVVTHRAAPRFHYPDAVDDVQRAVRFVRHNAGRYGIRADRIGAMGGSSGGHLVSMLGTLDGTGMPDSSDPVDRESAKVQCVVALYPVTDLAKMDTPAGFQLVTSFMGMPPRYNSKLYQEAAPVNHVTSDDAPFLLIHGDGDRTVPFRQSELMEAALKNAHVMVKVVRVPGGDHDPAFRPTKEKADWPAMALEWFDS